MLNLSDVVEEDESTDASTNGTRQEGSTSSRPSSTVERDGPCVRTLEGHTKAVSAMYFEVECLVRANLDYTYVYTHHTIAGYRCV